MKNNILKKTTIKYEHSHGGDGGASNGGSRDGGSAIGGIIAGSVVGGIVLLPCCCYCGLYCLWGQVGILRGWPLRSNRAYIRSGIAMQYDMSESIFISGTFASYYYQYRSYHGPHDIELVFYPQAGYIVHGGGKDDVGTYIITGIYSPRTLRMGLEKHYQRGTGNPKENLGHIVTIQVEWNIENQQFEGKYYLQTEKLHDENTFIIRYEGKKQFHPYIIQSQV